MSQSTVTPASGPSKDPINMRASRIASLAMAANLVLSRNALPDPQQAEAIAIDLMDVASYLAAQLATDTEDIEDIIAKWSA